MKTAIGIGGWVAPNRFVALGFCLSVLVCSVGVTPGSAYAQAADARVAARAAFAEGVAKFQAADYEGALAAFERAYALRPHPTVRLNIANCYEQLGDYHLALSAFHAFLTEAGESAAPEQTEEVQTAVRRLERRVAYVELAVDPVTATVMLDGDAMAPEARVRPLPVLPGQHTFDASAPGFTSTHMETRLRAGQRQRVVITLTPAANQTMPELPGLGAGLRGTEGPTPSESRPIAIERDDDEGRWLGMKPAVAVTGGIGAAFLVAGVTTGLFALSADADFEDAVRVSNDPNRTAEQRARARSDGLDAASSADGFALAADVFFVGAVISAGVATYLYLSEPEAPTREGTSSRGGGYAVVSQLRDGGAVLQLGRSF